ncbi:MAG TPA: transposase [Terriglobia bacterium]|nr:transposase [Terriglobia bacterium]
MGKVTPITEQFQHFVRDLKESFWGELYGKTRLAWERFWEEESRRLRDRYLVADSYERESEERRGYRNGYYVRDFLTRLGTLRVRPTSIPPEKDGIMKVCAEDSKIILE